MLTGNYKLRFLFFMLLLVASFPLAAQQRFQGGLIAGFTASQINGDESVGYNKLGLQAGGRVAVNTGKRTAVSLEMLFSQRGSQSEFIKDEFSFNYFSLTLNYIDVPVLFHFKDWYVEDGDNSFYRVSLDAGLSYSRYIDGRANDDLSALNTVTPLIRKNDFNYILGASIYLNRHLGFSLRTARGIGLIYDPTEHQAPPEKDPWYSHSLYFQVKYDF